MLNVNNDKYFNDDNDDDCNDEGCNDDVQNEEVCFQQRMSCFNAAVYCLVTPVCIFNSATDVSLLSSSIVGIFFIGPRCPWGPIYGWVRLSQTNSLSERGFCRLN